jgi:ribosome-binding protein aMBF1 (putative translation factor)
MDMARVQYDLNEQLRRAIDKSGLTRYEIAKRAELSYSLIHTFCAGSRTITLDSASHICEILGMSLRKVKK